MRPISHLILGHNPSVLWPSQRVTHTHVVGQPGTGKSRALESWVMQDIRAGHGVGVIDPHGDLYQNLSYRLAAEPRTWKKLVLIDPLDESWTACFNPLESIRGLPTERVSQFLTDVALKIWKIDPTSAPRLVWLLTNTFLALSDTGHSLLDLQRFLLEPSFREGLLERMKNEQARRYFQREFPSRTGSVHQWITPLLNKLGGLIFDPEVRLMLASPSTINFRKILDKGQILLVNLPKGLLGEGTSALVAAFIVAHLQKAALSRADLQNRRPYYLYLDEFQNYTTDNIRDILSESRKYALSLTLAHQYLDQLPTEIRQALLNTAGNLVCFRVGSSDASTLAREIFPWANYLPRGTQRLRVRRWGLLPRFALERDVDPSHWDDMAREVANLGHREFWFRRKGSTVPVKQSTFPMPDPAITTELEQQNRAMLAEVYGRFGRLKADIRMQLSGDAPTGVGMKEEGQDGTSGPSVPMWEG